MPQKSSVAKPQWYATEEDAVGLAEQIHSVSSTGKGWGKGENHEWIQKKKKKRWLFLIIPKYPFFVKQLSC